MIDEYQFFYNMGINLDEVYVNELIDEDDPYYDDNSFADSVEAYDP